MKNLKKIGMIKTVSELCKKYDLPKTSCRRLAKNLGLKTIKRKNNWQKQGLIEDHPCFDFENFKKDYYSGLSHTALAKKYNLSNNTITVIIKRNNLKK